MKSVPVTKISFNRRFNLGDYQHEEISVEANLLDYNGTAEEALLYLRELVAEHCTLRVRQKALQKEHEEEKKAREAKERNGSNKPVNRVQ